MRYIHPNWIVVELADDGVASCYYPACEPLAVDGLGLLTRIFTQLGQHWGDKLSKVCIENKMRASKPRISISSYGYWVSIPSNP